MIKITESRRKGVSEYHVTIESFPNHSRKFKVAHGIGNQSISVVTTGSGTILDYDLHRRGAEKKAYLFAKKYAERVRNHYDPSGNNSLFYIVSSTSFFRRRNSNVSSTSDPGQTLESLL